MHSRGLTRRAPACRRSPLIAWPSRFLEWRRERFKNRFRDLAYKPRKRKFWKEYRQWKKEEMIREWRWQNYYRRDWEFMIAATNRVMTLTWPFMLIFVLPPRWPFFVPMGFVSLFRARQWWHPFVDTATWGCVLGLWATWPARHLPMW